MNFTREPIIETVISPKDGYKLVVRNSKGGSQEEYVVDAIEVVSFGHSFFFRSLERPKSFLVPASDYEVIETKETRVVLKNASFERSIKIGGGKETSIKAQKQEETPSPEKLEKKRERRRHRRKKTPAAEKEETPSVEGGGAEDETKVSSSVLRRLIPPPTGLISEKFSKEKPPEQAEGDALSQEAVTEEEKSKKGRRKKKEEPKAEEPPIVEEMPPKPEAEDLPKAEEPKAEPSTEQGDMQRTSIEKEETVTSTSFSTISSKFPPFGKIW